MMAHFVTIRLEYHDHANGRTPWKRRGRCVCGWQCLSWDGLRPILIAAEHVAVARAQVTRMGEMPSSRARNLPITQS